MAKQLEAMSITRADNGGHTVRHEFKREVVKRGGAMSGGMYSDRPASEEHSFGPGDDAKLAAHVAEHLGLKMKGAEEADD